MSARAKRSKAPDLTGENQTRVCYSSDVGPGRPEITLIPWCCPVCQGRGWVPVGFYESWAVNPTSANPSCKSCDSTGIVWGAP